MAFDPKVFSQNVLSGLYESNRFFNQCDRSHDGEITDPWAKSIDIYRNPKLYVGNAAVAKNSSNRKKGTDGDTVNVPFQPFIIPLKEEIEEKMATNSALLAKRAADAVAALEENFDKVTYAAAVASIPAGNKDNIIGTDLSGKDLSKIRKFFTTNRIPNSNRYAIVHASLEDQFNDIDIVKAAQGYNRDLLENGVVRVRGINYIFSADVPAVDSKAPIIGIWAPSIAAIIKGTMKREEAYDPETAAKDIDYIWYAGFKRIYDNGVFVLKSQVAAS